MISPLRTLIIVTVVVMTPVDPQMPMYGMPPMPMAPPPPVHVPVPVPVHVPVPVPFAVLVSDSKSDKSSTSTTTTTTQKTALGLPIPIPVPVPMQMPMQLPYSFPAFPSAGCQRERPPGCPPCPPCLCSPSCTPAFFSYCSPCHLKCRCRSNEETPEPVPMAPPAPPPLGPLPYGVAYGAPMPRPMVFMIPFPRPVAEPGSDKACGGSISSELLSSDSSAETDCDISTSSDYESNSYFRSEKKHKKHKKKKKKKKEKAKKLSKKHKISRRESKNIEVQPVLSFVSRNGDVKIRRRLSNAQALQLLKNKRDNFDYGISKHDNLDRKGVNLDYGIRDNFDNSISKRDKTYNDRKSNVQHRRRQIILPRSLAHSLTKNEKMIVFKPPPGATISNLSMSFQIST